MLKYYVKCRGETVSDARVIPSYLKIGNSLCTCPPIYARAAAEHFDSYDDVRGVISWPLNFTIVDEEEKEWTIRVDKITEPIYVVMETEE